MAEKRYQVFVSSTFKDLQEERWEAVKALMTLDCIVAGMESFTAVDEEQFEYIKEVIDDCDYYLLILGGRYGSFAPDGIGYTEKEYDYARSKGIKVIALVHEKPEDLPAEKRENDAAHLARFAAFRERVCTNRLVSFWKEITDIQKDVALGMAKAMKKYPAVGWVRANTVASEDILRENNALQKEITHLKSLVSKDSNNLIKKLNENFPIIYFLDGNRDNLKSIDVNYQDIFRRCIDILVSPLPYNVFAADLNQYIFNYIRNKKEFEENKNFEIDGLSIEHLIKRFLLWELIESEVHVIGRNNTPVTYYSLSDTGRKIGMKLLSL